MGFIEAEKLMKKYDKKIAVNDISFSIEEGQVFGILGPNGAGKSTTIFMLSTLLKPDSGDILLNGKSMVTKPSLLRPILGLVPQDIALYPMLSARDNLNFWGRIYGIRNKNQIESRINEVAELVGLEDKMNEKVGTFSGGMKRRLNIAAALIHKPKVIIMDEPTVGIDVQSRSYIISAIKDLNANGATIIYTSHYIDEIEALCHQVAIVDQGKVLACGNIEQLRNRAGVKEKVIIKVEETGQDIAKLLLEVKTYFQDVEVNEKEENIEIAVDNVGSKLTKILNMFDRNNLRIAEVNIEKPNLEKVYLNIIEKKEEVASVSNQPKIN